MAKFEIGDIVCLTFDNSKRFIVTNTVSLVKDNNITVAYFNEYKGKISQAIIPEKYLIDVDCAQETCKTDDNDE